MSEGLSIPIPPAIFEGLVEEVTRRVLERVQLAEPDRTRWLSAREAADYLHWSPERVYKLAASRAIPHRKHEGRLLFDADELDEWLEGFREGPRVSRPRRAKLRVAP